MLPPSMCSFSSLASLHYRLLIFCLSLNSHCTITSTTYPPPQPDLISPSQSERLTVTFSPLDLESAEQLSDPADGDTSGFGINHPNWKRTGKIVMAVGLERMAMAMTLMVNASKAAAAHRDLYMAYMVIVYLVLFTGMGLSLFSVAMTGSPYVGWVQRRRIYFTLFFVSAACFLCLYLALLIANFYLLASRVLDGAALICLYLCLGRPAM